MNINPIIQEDFCDIVSGKTDWFGLSGKNILITGANGMLASYIVETLALMIKTGTIRDSQLFIMVRNERRGRDRFAVYLDEPFMHMIVQDVCERISIDSKIDMILHAASQASPKYYRIDPVGTINPNVIGTSNLLNLAREKKAESFLFFSSAEIYGSVKLPGDRPIGEKDCGMLDPVTLRSCYAESKRAGEALCVAWANQYGVPAKIVRPFHTYGPGMRPDDGRVFADFAFNIFNNQNIEIKSDGSARRSYCYLRDAAEAFLTILLNGTPGEAYNVGNPSQEYSVKELASILVNLFPEKSLKVVMNPQFLDPAYMPSQVDRVLPDIAKIQALGWQPRTDVMTGFSRTVTSLM